MQARMQTADIVMNYLLRSPSVPSLTSSSRTRSYIVLSVIFKSVPSGWADSDRTLSEHVDGTNGYLRPKPEPSLMTANCACLLPVIVILTAMS